MANWELQDSFRMDGFKVVRKAQCPYCDFIIEYGNGRVIVPPERCPDCGRELKYLHRCRYRPETKCFSRVGCYGCSVRDQETYNDF